jgi:type II secretory pathway pseudopilin PulG
MNSFSSNPFAARKRSAFSLVEILTVVAIASAMTVVALPAMSGLKSAGGLTKAAYDLAGSLEQARSYAVANNTYVFVGLSERDTADLTKEGTGRLLVVIMGSKDGTRDFGTSNSNLIPLAKARLIDNIHLADTLPNTGNLARPEVTDEFRMGNSAWDTSNAFSWTFKGVAAGCSFTKIVQFDPRGVASIPTTVASVPDWMEIGLVEAKGSTVTTGKNCAALVVDGVTGSVRIYRP